MSRTNWSRMSQTALAVENSADTDSEGEEGR